MNWLERLSRNAGLMIHNIMHPDREKMQVSKTAEEKKLNDNVTLRRTTIEEIEVNRKSKI